MNNGKPVTATEAETALAYGWVVQMMHPTGARLYGPFGDEDAAISWMVNNGPANTLFTVLPVFDRLWE